MNIFYFPTIHCASDTTKETTYDVFSSTDFLNIWTNRAWPTTSSIKLIRNRTYTISSSLSLLVGLTQVLQNIIHTILSGAKKRFKESHCKSYSPNLIALFPLILRMYVICNMLLLVGYSCDKIKAETHKKFWEVGLFVQLIPNYEGTFSCGFLNISYEMSLYIHLPYDNWSLEWVGVASLEIY